MTNNTRYWEIFRAAYSHNPLLEKEKNSLLETYNAEGKEKILEIAKKKKLVPAISNLFNSLDVDKDFWEPIIANYRSRNEKVVDCLDEMYRLLTDNGIDRIAVVENFGALLASHEDISMFGSGDIDQYADPNQRERIINTLEKYGYSIENTKIGKLWISTTICKKDSFPENFYFGINWDVTNRINLPCFTAKGDFINWDRVVYYGDTQIRLPSPEGLMYVCLMHIAVHGFCKAPDIRLYYDIANCAENNIDWHQIVDWAERDQNCVKISTAAYLAHRLLGVEIPTFVFEIGNRKQQKKLLSVAYNEDKNMLNDFPGRLDSIKIEIFSNERGSVMGIWQTIFPEAKWIKQKYGSLFIGRIKHIASLI